MFAAADRSKGPGRLKPRTAWQTYFRRHHLVNGVQWYYNDCIAMWPLWKFQNLKIENYVWHPLPPERIHHQRRVTIIIISDHLTVLNMILKCSAYTIVSNNVAGYRIRRVDILNSLMESSNNPLGSWYCKLYMIVLSLIMTINSLVAILAQVYLVLVNENTHDIVQELLAMLILILLLW